MGFIKTAFAAFVGCFLAISAIIAIALSVPPKEPQVLLSGVASEGYSSHSYEDYSLTMKCLRGIEAQAKLGDKTWEVSSIIRIGADEQVYITSIASKELGSTYAGFCVELPTSFLTPAKIQLRDGALIAVN